MSFVSFCSFLLFKLFVLFEPLERPLLVVKFMLVALLNRLVLFDVWWKFGRSVVGADSLGELLFNGLGGRFDRDRLGCWKVNFVMGTWTVFCVTFPFAAPIFCGFLLNTDSLFSFLFVKFPFVFDFTFFSTSSKLFSTQLLNSFSSWRSSENSSGGLKISATDSAIFSFLCVFERLPWPVIRSKNCCGSFKVIFRSSLPSFDAYEILPSLDFNIVSLLWTKLT